MKKETYLHEVELGLFDLAEDLRKDIIHGCEIEYDALMEDGYTEEQIIEELGTPEKVIERSLDTYGPKPGPQEISLFPKLTASLAYAFKQFQMGSYVDKVEKYFTTSGMTEIPLDHLVDELIIDGGKRPVNVYIRSGELLQYRLEPNDADVSPKMKVTMDDTAMTLRPTGGKLILTLFIPNSIERIVVKTGGNVYCSKLCADNIILEKSNKSTYIDHCRIGALRAVCTSSDTYISNSRFSMLDVQAKSGDVQVEKSEGTVFISTKSGDVKICDHSGEKCTVSTGSGDIIVNSDFSILQLSANSGDIVIRDNSVLEILAASTSCGDISCWLNDHVFTAEIFCKHGEFHNHTFLPVERLEKQHYRLGSGQASVALTTKNGDISIH